MTPPKLADAKITATVGAITTKLLNAAISIAAFGEASTTEVVLARASDGGPCAVAGEKVLQAEVAMTFLVL